MLDTTSLEDRTRGLCDRPEEIMALQRQSHSGRQEILGFGPGALLYVHCRGCDETYGRNPSKEEIERYAQRAPSDPAFPALAEAVAESVYRI